MLERGHTLRFYTSSLWRDLSSRGSLLASWLHQGHGLGTRQTASISALGQRLLSLRQGDATLAVEMARGKFNFPGIMISAKPAQVFASLQPVQNWETNLYDLQWLQHFCTSDQELHRMVARPLILKWGNLRKTNWHCKTIFRSLISLSLASHFLVGARPSSFSEPLFSLVEDHIRLVAGTRARTAEQQLLQAVSLLYAGLAFRFPPAFREVANSKFNAVINQVVLPDGGHISRNPYDLLECLLDLIPIKLAMINGREAVPNALSAAIERMLPMLRMLSHGDQGLGFFQGFGSGQTNQISAVLEHDKCQGRPLMLAPHSGFGRISHGSGVLLMDLGRPQKCNGTLAFEFSDGNHRLFTNCGMPVTASAAWQSAAADIAAHNTMEIVGFSQGTINRPKAEAINSPRGTLISCRNEISTRHSTIAHDRNVFLAQNGRDLRGEDQIIFKGKSATRNLDFVIRFHLHPAVKASAVRKGANIVLLLPNKFAWQFSASGGALTLEESVFLGDERGPRKSQQIVIRGNTASTDTVKWALKRVKKSVGADNSQEESLLLPF